MVSCESPPHPAFPSRWRVNILSTGHRALFETKLYNFSGHTGCAPYFSQNNQEILAFLELMLQFVSESEVSWIPYFYSVHKSEKRRRWTGLQAPGVPSQTPVRRPSMLPGCIIVRGVGGRGSFRVMKLQVPLLQFPSAPDHLCPLQRMVHCSSVRLHLTVRLSPSRFFQAPRGRGGSAHPTTATTRRRGGVSQETGKCRQTECSLANRQR